jgi:DNA-binding transcriptional ArsR family regulator
VSELNRQLQEFKSNFFKVLSHPMRIRILELLSEGDKSVNQLQVLLGSEGAAVSQQLAILRAKSIVDAKKEGTKVIYSLRDPMIMELLGVARKIFNNHLISTINMLSNFNEEHRE